jgi:hypothetical protein
MGISSALGSSALLPAGLGFRNLIINGDMRIHQRGGTTTVTGANAYNVDRWYGFSSGTFTMQQSTDTPTGTNFSNSLLVTCTGADASIAAGDFNSISQRIEGYGSASLGYGTANQTNVLTFWVKSSLTGTYCVSFRNSAVNKSYVVEYTINLADTWEKKVIYLTSDIAGTWGKTNGIGIRLDFSLAMGTNFHTTPNAWSSGSFTSTSNQVNWMSSASSRTFYLTGVQLEANYQPTPFDQRPIGVELALCQRYYQVLENSSVYTYFASGEADTSTNFEGILHLPVSMRENISSIITSGTASHYSVYGSALQYVCTAVPFGSGNKQTVHISASTTGLTAGRAYLLITNNTTSGYLAFSTEL